MDRILIHPMEVDNWADEQFFPLWMVGLVSVIKAMYEDSLITSDSKWDRLLSRPLVSEWDVP